MTRGKTRKASLYSIEKYFDTLDRKEREYAQLKQDRKTIVVSTQDKNDIGLLSSGWSDFIPALKTSLRNSRNLGYTKADEIAHLWNETGFKTGSGKAWTPRLVNIAKHLLGIKHGLNIIEH